MNLLPSSEQQQIIDTLSAFLSENAPAGRLRQHGALGNPDGQLWPLLGELGFLGLGLDESDGGVGLSSAEEALVYREFGRHLVSIGIFGLTLGAHIAAAQDDQGLLNQILSGDLIVGVGNAFGDSHIGPEGCSGEFHWFEARNAMFVILVDETGAALIATDDCHERREVNATDASLVLERVTLNNIKPRCWISNGTSQIYSRALLLTAAYATGLSEATRDMAVAYAKDRQQFGKPIGAFQAIKHMCADMAIRTEAAQSQAFFAALVFAENRIDLTFQVVSSKIVATDTALKNAAVNIQVHGAYGFTAEADAHHFLKRAHVADQLWGDLRSQRARLLKLPPAAQ